MRVAAGTVVSRGPHALWERARKTISGAARANSGRQSNPRSSYQDGLRPKPLRGERAEDEECDQRDDLTCYEGRFGLCWGYRVEYGNLLEGLHDQHDEIEVEGEHRSDDVHPTPDAGEMAGVAGIDNRGQDHQRDHTECEARRHTLDREPEAGHARRHRGRQEEGGPAIEPPTRDLAIIPNRTMKPEAMAARLMAT